ncbi:MAG: TIGR03564 family F420-dependent LLM class oxidoreductase [Pseudomonadales bacterium]|jgi:F420-dependent oxidoreductase-like protein|nr:TIGR03564 family F420-dependent LLM class oxidoreductase [Pseudomonadales bacterium]MDP7357313.1 TIGR03564 family F420-dependent LLM class oxidoreductase [Pseudomonadales bacterium]MDP7595938.1 TIGR03564 family F420-dependent LLM class oxidoreductase [Pseudomonadales bacterium]HJN49276.1 TIGR03564 family F420-dependent LLM class oxidoreductase [Pseudomonadales bacterium]|tara:strand:- start:608 stop:1525 length:918 start_codon:yes stop_codon:yes gene_type:complete
MKIGIYGGNVRRGAPLTSVIDEIVDLEGRGFHSYWFPQVATFDALTIIALAGEKTSSIELGTAVVPSYPRHPSTVAQQAATANVLTGGRLVLGVGPSHRPGIENSLGLKYDRPALHMREYVSIIKSLADEGRVDFQGDMYQVRTGFMVPDAQPFPVVISALAPLMLKAAGEVADGTVTWMVGQKTVETNTSPRIRKAAADAGRGEPRIIVGLPVCVHDDKEEATARAVQIFQGYSQTFNYRRQLDAEGLDQAGEIAVVGNEQEVTDQLKAYFSAGATEVIASVYPAGASGRESFQRTNDLLASLL